MTDDNTSDNTEAVTPEEALSNEAVETQAPVEEVKEEPATEEAPEAQAPKAKGGGFEMGRNWSVSKGKQAKGTGRHWYVLHTYSGYEDAVEKALRQRIEALNMQEYIFDIKVPKEGQIVIKRGEPVQEKKRIFPGYVLVDMIVTDDSWYVVRNTPNVTGFVGAGNIPVPVTPEEFGIIEKRTGENEPKFKIEFKIGEHVAITSGPFANYDGIIDKVDAEKGKVRVLVSIFDRETPIELDFTQVKKK